MGHLQMPLALAGATVGGAYIDSLGHAGMLVRNPRDGRIEATHDPRSDGGALGL